MIWSFMEIRKNMKPELLICSARDAFRYVLSHFNDPQTGRPPQTKDHYAAISIQDSGEWSYGFMLTTNRFCDAVLTLAFDDFEEPESGVCLMNEHQAEKIIAFLEQNRNTETILIHCFAGKSRSAAVGKFAAEYLGLPEPDCTHFNLWVYDTLMKYMKIIKHNAQNVQDSEH